jgi:phytoene synthase
LPPRRRAITCFYAFCREADDVVDDCREPAIALAKLAWWREEVGRLYAGVPQHPVTRALADAIGPFGIPRESLEEILDGMEMDLNQTRYADFSQLHLYCHRVAGVVGEVAARIFGYSRHGTLDYAARLGLAFQLTNILRDVGEDARRGRIYLPQDELARFNVAESDLLAGRETEGFKALMEFQYQRAVDTYDQAMALLPGPDRKAQRPGLIMAAVYRDLLEAIRDEGFPVLKGRTSLTPLRKLWLAWRTWFKG